MNPIRFDLDSGFNPVWRADCDSEFFSKYFAIAVEKRKRILCEGLDPTDVMYQIEIDPQDWRVFEKYPGLKIVGMKCIRKPIVRGPLKISGNKT